ncbi:MAG: hypothetical protein LBB75_07680 [Oscillospiraceae bacterium]|jgi:hypothetical protein|nr:hypothetical protein [Oscillospiraceae bacterium]
MKRIGFVTANKVLAQSLAATIESRPEWELEPCLLLNPGQAALDAEVLRLDAVVIDVADMAPDETDALCRTLRRTAGCQLLLLAPKTGRRMAVGAVRNRTADDFIFCDTSLDYLLAKLAAI